MAKKKRVQSKPPVKAEVHSDDYRVEIEFDAASWFAQATNDEILALAAIDWGGDYAADNVARFFSDTTTKKLFDYSGLGFECHVNEKTAMKWLKLHRPNLYKAIEMES